ncbi:hypothetical protein KUTeg_001713 [Tegillarca granosa]|uniref:Uncharacterized protein n=1 Tax=Tegillarca granosa TaxID=220873 RepID=A0ABQ9FVE6_TEGGR|nr:hypothetical protein KUTeg_001713 [Tegillarca granosa]
MADSYYHYKKIVAHGYPFKIKISYFNNHTKAIYLVGQNIVIGPKHTNHMWNIQRNRNNEIYIRRFMMINDK